MSNDSDNSSHLLMGRKYASWTESFSNPPKPPQSRGLFHLLKTNYTIIISPIFGIACTIGAFIFTLWFGRQTFKCPSWAIDCKESATILVNNYGLVQGIVSTVHGIGMAAIAYPAYAFASAALWPIFHERSHRLNKIDTYLAASRGSIPALFQAIAKSFGGRTFMVLPFVMIIAVLVQVDAAIVGTVFTRQNITKEFESKYDVGGGIGLRFKQENPPGALPAPITFAMNLYASWSNNLAPEPLPNLRNFFMDREKIQERGNMSAKAIKIQQNVSCTGTALNISADGEIDKKVLSRYRVEIPTHFASGAKDGDDVVIIRMQPRLTLWVDNIVYNDEWSAVTTIIFAAIGGEIENGTKTPPTAGMRSFNLDGISAVACDVNTTLLDSTFSIGEDTEDMKPSQTVSRLEKITFNDKKMDNQNIAAWLGLAAVTNGYSVLGAQPMFNFEGDKLPTMFTTASSKLDDPANTKWTISQLKKFISVSTGALAITMSRQWIKEKGTLTSRKAMLQLDPRRAYILLAPPIAVLVMILVIAVTVVWFYRRDRIPGIYLVGVSDLVAFTQNQDMCTNSRVDLGANQDSSILGDMRVRYGITQEGQIGLGSPETVSCFG